MTACCSLKYSIILICLKKIAPFITLLLTLSEQKLVLKDSSEIKIWAKYLENHLQSHSKGNSHVDYRVNNWPFFAYKVSKNCLWTGLWYSWRVCVKIIGFKGTVGRQKIGYLRLMIHCIEVNRTVL